MRRTLASLTLCFLSSVVAVGCGFGVSQSEHEADAGPPPDAGPVPCTSLPPSTPCPSSCTGQPQSHVCENDVWTCPAEICPSPPPPTCSGPQPACYDCNGAPVSPLCNGGDFWQCPAYGCPIEIDAGCGEPPPAPCEGAVPCTGETWALTCDGSGHWTCALEGECQDVPDSGPPDTGPPDAGPPDATPPPLAPFACVNVGCDPETSYEYLSTLLRSPIFAQEEARA